MKTLKELSDAAFDASQRVNMLSLQNSSFDYEERKRQHAELCQALQDKNLAEQALAQSIYSSASEVKNTKSPIEEAGTADEVDASN